MADSPSTKSAPAPAPTAGTVVVIQKDPVGSATASADFKYGLCDCLSVPSMCLASCCCCGWPCLFSQIGSRMSYFPLWASNFAESYQRMWILVGIGFLAFVLANIGTATETPALNTIAQIIDYILAVLILIVGFLMRTTLKEKLGFAANPVCDCLLAWCCNCCSIVQMGREVDVKDPWA